MAKVTITIEDAPNGKLKVQSTPNFETIMKMDVAGEVITGALGCGLKIMNFMYQEGEKAKRGHGSPILIPSTRRY
jgi:hypothetical protein